MSRAGKCTAHRRPVSGKAAARFFERQIRDAENDSGSLKQSGPIHSLMDRPADIEFLFSACRVSFTLNSRRFLKIGLFF